MKASPRSPGRLWPVLAGLAAATLTAGAQDAVVMKSGLTREGKITGLSGANLRLQVEGGSTGIPLAEIREIRMDAPPEFDAAASRLARGDAAGAVAALQAIEETYAGLPARWAEQAAALLGDAKLAAGDQKGAAAAYEKLIQTYPEATGLANLGRARLAVEGGRFDQASPLLASLLATSDQTAFPAASDAPALCQAHLLNGRVQEAAGAYQAALASYLKASALFPFDPNAAPEAQRRADALRAEHAGLSAP